MPKEFKSIKGITIEKVLFEAGVTYVNAEGIIEIAIQKLINVNNRISCFINQTSPVHKMIASTKYKTPWLGI